jgi:hypothetical protein
MAAHGAIRAGAPWCGQEFFQRAARAAIELLSLRYLTVGKSGLDTS